MGTPSKESHLFLGYNIVFTTDFFLNFLKGTTFAIITDQNVEHIWGKKLIQHFGDAGYEAKLFAFPAGERSKHLGTYEKLIHAMSHHGVRSSTHLIALGGGVVTDLAGFIASTYHRGMPLTLLPTTLLATVDAAIGGKTALNTVSGKNQIGTFYAPTNMIADATLLSTLPEQEWYHGCSELLKYGLICSEEFFQFLEDNPYFWTEVDKLKGALETGMKIKLEVCSKDPRELSGFRRVLNFGHTIAHALEKLTGYQMPHGAAVAKGLYLESLLSGLDEHSLLRIEALLGKWGYTTELPNFPMEQWMDALRHDKKADGQIRFVKIKKIGHLEKEILTPLTQEDLACALEKVSLQGA